MSIDTFSVKDFMTFSAAEFNFSKGINVLIGENATGKTQLLKLLYSLYNNENIIQQDIFFSKGYKPSLERVFQEDRRYVIGCENKKVNCVFVPVKDMLTHAKGFISMYNKYAEFPFDKTLTSIIEKAERWKVSEVPALAKKIIYKLEGMLSGEVVIENGEFYVKKENGLMVKFDVEAEGLKKIGLLWQLLMNESITENTVLLWDEPEANLNPKFIPDLVEILLELSRNNVQIFLTTHSYIFAKYFEIRRKDSDDILFHSLYKTENSGVLCENNRNFKDLQNNAISKSFEKLLDEVYDLNAGE